jgi:hypothetical protein
VRHAESECRHSKALQYIPHTQLALRLNEVLPSMECMRRETFMRSLLMRITRFVASLSMASMELGCGDLLCPCRRNAASADRPDSDDNG